MSCENVQENLVEFLLGDLSKSRALAVEEHLQSGCAACRQELTELREGMDILVESDFRGRAGEEEVHSILDAVSQRSLESKPTPVQQPVLNASHLPALDGLLLAASFAAGLLLVIFSSPGQLSSPPPTANAPAELQLPQSEDQAQIVLTSMSSQDVIASVEAVLLFDRSLGELHFFGTEMSQPPPGQQFVLRIGNGANAAVIPIEVDNNGIGTATIANVSAEQIAEAAVELQPKDGGNASALGPVS